MGLLNDVSFNEQELSKLKQALIEAAAGGVYSDTTIAYQPVVEDPDKDCEEDFVIIQKTEKTRRVPPNASIIKILLSEADPEDVDLDDAEAVFDSLREVLNNAK